MGNTIPQVVPSANGLTQYTAASCKKCAQSVGGEILGDFRVTSSLHLSFTFFEYSFLRTVVSKLETAVQ